MIPGTSTTRFTIVMSATMAAFIGVALAIGDTRPLLALGLTLGICILSSAVLPSRTWVRFAGFCRWIPWALDHKGMKPPRTLVILSLASGAYLGVDMPVFARSIPAGLAVLAAITATAGLAIWRPGRDTIRQWRDERIEDRRLTRQLLEMDAHDSEDFSGKGIPRKDWAAFNDVLAGVLREMRASEGQDQ